MDRRVILRSDEDEVFLGTVGEVLGEEETSSGGMSLSAVLVDIVSDLAFDSGKDSRLFIIELRDPR